MLESYFKSHDHHRLYYQVWKAKPCKAVLIFVHGLNEHSGRYGNPVKYFSKRGYSLYLYDHRGHGKSDGLRSFVDDFDHYLEDLHEFTQLVAKKEKGGQLFMVGHSMGGQIVLNYAARYKNPLAGVITSSANIQMANGVSWVKKMLGVQLSKVIPRFSLTNEVDPKLISRDPDVVRAYKRDPLVSKKITLKLAAELIHNQEQIMNLAPKVKIPILLMHAGDDQICAREGSERFFLQVVSEDKEIKIYDRMYHEIFNEFGKEKVFADMETWLNKQLG